MSGGSNTGGPSSSFMSRLWQAVLVLLAAAIVSRLAWELLRPLLPGLLVVAVLVGIISLAAGRRRY